MNFWSEVFLLWQVFGMLLLGVFLPIVGLIVLACWLDAWLENRR